MDILKVQIGHSWRAHGAAGRETERRGAVENDEWSYQALCEVPHSAACVYRAGLISRRETVSGSHTECCLAVSRATDTHSVTTTPSIPQRPQ